MHATLGLAALLIGCGGGGPSMDDLLRNPKVATALKQVHARGLDTLACAFGRWPNDGHPPDLEGTWDFSSQCNIFATSDGSRLGPCAGQVTYSNQSGETIMQSNTGAVSMGMGDVDYIVGIDNSMEVFAEIGQQNHAVGSGCSQDLINLITVVRGVSAPTNQWSFCGLTVLLVNNGCPPPTPDWQLAAGTFVKQ
jgi:hypothetical protein